MWIVPRHRIIRKMQVFILVSKKSCWGLGLPMYVLLWGERPCIMTTTHARDRPTDSTRPGPARFGSVRARARAWLCGVNTYIFGPEKISLFELFFLNTRYISELTFIWSGKILTRYFSRFIYCPVFSFSPNPRLYIIFSCKRERKIWTTFSYLRH